MLLEEVIKRPLLLTEKGTRLRESENQYSFEVALKANKVEIKKAIETLFSVKVDSVNTLIVRGKTKRMGRGTGQRKNWKKALVTLKDGETIEFEGA
jgi:large subunit ribosomal protein L23